MGEASFGLNVDLRLQSGNFVAEAKKVEQAEAGVERKARDLDRVLDSQLKRSFEVVGRTAAGAWAEIDRGATRAAQSVDRFTAAANRAATASSNAGKGGARAFASDLFKDASRSAFSGALVTGSSFAFGTDPLSAALGGGLGGALAQATSKLPVIAALGSGLAAATLAGKELIDTLAGFDSIDDSIDETNAALEELIAKQEALQQLSFRMRDFEQAADRAAMTLTLAENEAARFAAREEGLSAAVEAKQAETRALQQELDKQLAAERMHAAALAALPGARAGAAFAAGDARFRLGAAAAGSTAELEGTTLARVRELATEGRIFQGGGAGDQARERFAQAQKLLEGLFQAIGAPAERLGEFQAAIASLAAEIDASFVASLDKEAAAHQAAAAQVQTLTAAVTTAGAELSTLKAQLDAVAAASKQAAVDLEAAIRAQSAAANALSGLKSDVAQGTLPGLARGGGFNLPGPTDTIPALLTEGEAVLSREHTKKLAPLLKAVGVPGFADGGFAELLGGTRRFTELSTAAVSADSSALSGAKREYIARLAANYERSGLRGLAAYQAAYAFVAQHGGFESLASFQAPTSLAAGFQGFANGGIAQAPSQTVTVGDVYIDYRSQGGTQRDARALGQELRREVRRGALRLT